jgi:hypothetical protein
MCRLLSQLALAFAVRPTFGGVLFGVKLIFPIGRKMSSFVYVNSN